MANTEEIRVYNELIKQDDGELPSVLNSVLRAEERRSRNEYLYYEAVCEYNKTLVRLNYLKGSILDNNSIQWSEDGKKFK